MLKIVDFGVSEMFEKESEMSTAKSAGSPAFMPPELCVAKHGQVSGRAADIWSMGVTLYCLRYGQIPFEKHGMLELYEAIRNDDINLREEQNPDFADLMLRLLEKDPDRRINMEELRVSNRNNMNLDISLLTSHRTIRGSRREEAIHFCQQKKIVQILWTCRQKLSWSMLSLGT